MWSHLSAKFLAHRRHASPFLITFLMTLMQESAASPANQYLSAALNVAAAAPQSQSQAPDLLQAAQVAAAPTLLAQVTNSDSGVEDSKDATPVTPPSTPNSPAQLQNAMVTGHRSDSTDQKTAASSDKIGGEQIEKNAVPDIATLIQSVAGVSLKTEGVGQTEIEIRGMTSSGGSSPTTGFYLDDVPLSPPAGAQNGKVVVSPSLYDMLGVDVLRGPDRWAAR
jgi:outer membrane receptor for Fe3+-dicitrate